jgi:hypothetical protein
MHDLQIKHKDRVKHRDWEECNEGGHGEPADLRVAEWFPQGPNVQDERDQTKDGGAHGDHDRPQADDAGIEERFAQRFALSPNTAHLIKFTVFFFHE